MSKWKSIETAPKDKVILLSDGKYVAKGKFEYGDFYIINNGDYCEGGYGQDYLCRDDDWDSYAMPTHWRPVPRPPKVESK